MTLHLDAGPEHWAAGSGGMSDYVPLDLQVNAIGHTFLRAAIVSEMAAAKVASLQAIVSAKRRPKRSVQTTSRRRPLCGSARLDSHSDRFNRFNRKFALSHFLALRPLLTGECLPGREVMGCKRREVRVG